MKGRLWFLLAVLCFFVSISNAQNTKVNSYEKLPKILLSTDKISIAGSGCPNDWDERIGTQTEIAVQTENVSPNVASKDYKYKVSAGQITGEGRFIYWDIKGEKPGSYTITVEVIQNGKITTANNSITVFGVDCCGLCECARVSINASSTEIKKGETVRFQVLIEDGTQDHDEITYKWEVIGGKILDGQGLNEIVVEPNPNNKTELTATVEIGGLCSPVCPNSDSVTVKIKDK